MKFKCSINKTLWGQEMPNIAMDRLLDPGSCRLLVNEPAGHGIGLLVQIWRISSIVYFKQAALARETSSRRVESLGTEPKAGKPVTQHILPQAIQAGTSPSWCPNVDMYDYDPDTANGTGIGLHWGGFDLRSM